MIKDIWHTADETPESCENIAFYVDGYLFSDFYKPQYNQYGIFGASKIEKWCYMRELSSYILALETELEHTRKAADKAERLEKENEAMREEFEVWHENYKCEIEEKKRLQKAVDLALDMLLEISDGYDIMAADSETIKRLFYTIQDNAKNTRDEIKQLIKETTNDK